MDLQAHFSQLPWVLVHVDSRQWLSQKKPEEALRARGWNKSQIRDQLGCTLKGMILFAL